MRKLYDVSWLDFWMLRSLHAFPDNMSICFRASRFLGLVDGLFGS